MTTHSAPMAHTHRSTAQMAAMATSAVFLLVGILGFIPGITSEYDTMSFAGPNSEAMLLGVFQVSILHNIVHLAFGVVGFLMAREHAMARNYLIGGGAIYLLLWLYGLFVEGDQPANLVPMNMADDWLHLALGVLMVGAGLALRRPTRSNGH